MITLFDEREREAVTLRRLNSAQVSDEECRERGDSRFLHRTDVVSLGYGYDQEPYFVMRFPYEEREKSPALDAEQTPAEAFYPLDEEKFFYTFEYEITIGRYDILFGAWYMKSSGVWRGRRKAAEKRQFPCHLGGKRRWRSEKTVWRRHTGSSEKTEPVTFSILIRKRDMVLRRQDSALRLIRSLMRPIHIFWNTGLPDGR